MYVIKKERFCAYFFIFFSEIYTAINTSNLRLKFYKSINYLILIIKNKQLRIHLKKITIVLQCETF